MMCICAKIDTFYWNGTQQSAEEAKAWADTLIFFNARDRSPHDPLHAINQLVVHETRKGEPHTLISCLGGSGWIIRAEDGSYFCLNNNQFEFMCGYNK